jgi:hypothetical protein
VREEEEARSIPDALSWTRSTGLRGFVAVHHRDGNGDPIPDSPWGIPLLGDGDGEISSPTGM